MNRYVITGPAEDDLAAIFDYIKFNGSEARAERMLGKFLEAFERLVDFPKIGSIRPYAPTNIRWLPVVPYIVAYDAETKPIQIHRVFHGAQDIPTRMSGFSQPGNDE